MIKRCAWVGESEIYQAYHDQEWGKPQYDSQKLFEQFCLEGQQAGLSWITVLKKREAYRQAFFHFQPEKIAQMNESDLDQLMQNAGLIRHRLKLQAIIKNAHAYLAMQANGEDFSDFIWSFVQHQPQSNSVQRAEDLPSKTPTSTAMSKALKKRGFAFVGETTCYAFMQAVGLVDDHFDDCFCKKRKSNRL
ncbi:DNA-3-methyladenine glycosidase [Haemophilus paracuniculus]|uniref:DNA-3-methyladenine glycosylase I n=1 Tax=Haemophilus paracuniculus TaxID=734 RepID=A0A1T0AVQ7_9PAST|nr:DNA-3-methyladenine glycosylase I [Haemophilus paracuniculus]OOS00783.1 DNA-3-methyladenine glycosidase [Haemophilus paracuniculus]